jgi:hypothetical protein
MILAVAISLLLIAGTILTPIQSSYAAPRGTKGGGNPDTSSLTHDIRSEVRANLDNAREHMNQKNVCFRSNTCRQSNVGQNTLGNDNQVTGFADQSDNLQQSSLTNQTSSRPPTTPPTHVSESALLTVTKMVVGNTTVHESNFTIHVIGNNPNPANFAGSPGGVDVRLGPGAFNVTETPNLFLFPIFRGNCSGTIAAGQHLRCTIINSVTVP